MGRPNISKFTGKLVPTNEIKTVVEHVTRRQDTPILFTIYRSLWFSINIVR